MDPDVYEFALNLDMTVFIRLLNDGLVKMFKEHESYGQSKSKRVGLTLRPQPLSKDQVVKMLIDYVCRILEPPLGHGEDDNDSDSEDFCINDNQMNKIS